MTPARNPVYPIILVRTAQASVLALVLHWVFHRPLTGPHALGLVFTPLLCLYFVFVFVAPWSWGLPIQTRLPTRDNAVALTFDDGPARETTPAILDTLARHGVRATFFVLGENVTRQSRPPAPHHRRRAWHRHPRQPSRAVCLAVMEKGGGRRSRRHGPLSAEPVPTPWNPSGCARRTASRHSRCPGSPRRAGCRLVAWNVNARDYQTQDAQTVAHNVLRPVKPGAIILLHDGHASQPTAAALPHILDGLRERGYRCVLL